MLITLEAENQVTIPEEIISRLGLHPGDRFEIAMQNGMIQLVPVAVYPAAAVDTLQAEADKVKEHIVAGTQPVFHTPNELLEALEN